MTRYVLGRFVGIIGVLFIVSIMIFLMIHTIPGGPFDAMPTTSEFREIPEHIREKLMAKYGLDKPLYVQYFRYMWAALRGDFGISFRYGEPVTDFISRSWPATAQLGLSAMAIGIPIGIGLGIVAALRPNTWLDYLTNVVVITTFVTPVFRYRHHEHHHFCGDIEVAAVGWMGGTQAVDPAHLRLCGRPDRRHGPLHAGQHG